MSNWKKEFKKDLNENLAKETPRVEKLEKTEPKKRMPLWGKILIPVGAVTVLSLAIAFPLALRKNGELSNGEVFLKAGDALAELVKPDSPNAQVRAKVRLSTSEGKSESAGVASMIYYIGLLVDNGYDVIHQPMNFAASYNITDQGQSYAIDLRLMVAADLDRAADKLIFYGRQKFRIHDPSNATPFIDKGRFVYDITYDEKSDTVYSFCFNINFVSSVLTESQYIEYDGASYWKNTGEDSQIKNLFAGYFAIVEEREAAAIDAQGGERLFADANNHESDLIGYDGHVETIA